MEVDNGLAADGGEKEGGFFLEGADPSLEEGFSGELKTEADYKFNTNKKMLGDIKPLNP